MKKNLYNIFAESWLKDCDSIWLYSDPHFGDLEVYSLRGLIDLPVDTFYANEEYMSQVKKLDEMQIKNINTKCGKTSCLIILGDVGDIECVKKLRAKRKILVLGNHDKGASNYKRVIKEEPISDEKGIYMSTSHVVEDNHLFDEVYEGPLMINDRLILSHEPIYVPDYMFNIHGHCHYLPYVYDAGHRNVCAEALDYTPISLTKLLKLGVLKNTKSIHRDYIDNRLETLAKEGSD